MSKDDDDVRFDLADWDRYPSEEATEDQDASDEDISPDAWWQDVVATCDAEHADTALAWLTSRGLRRVTALEHLRAISGVEEPLYPLASLRADLGALRTAAKIVDDLRYKVVESEVIQHAGASLQSLIEVLQSHEKMRTGEPVPSLSTSLGDFLSYVVAAGPARFPAKQVFTLLQVVLYRPPTEESIRTRVSRIRKARGRVPEPKRTRTAGPRGRKPKSWIAHDPRSRRKRLRKGPESS